MLDLWRTVLAPLLDAARPRVVLLAGTREPPLAELVAGLIEPWGGCVQGWAPDETSAGAGAAAYVSGEAELVVLEVPADPQPLEDLLDALVRAARESGRPEPTIVVHGVAQQLPAALARHAAAREDARTLLLPGFGGAAIVVEPALADDGYGRMRTLLQEFTLPHAAREHLVAVEQQRRAEQARAEQALTRLIETHESMLDAETLAAERDELCARVRELAA
jgi:hypothetical protein